jgi:hypothetical protein
MRIAQCGDEFLLVRVTAMVIAHSMCISGNLSVLQFKLRIVFTAFDMLILSEVCRAGSAIDARPVQPTSPPV